jgi:hypothetical protein
MVEERWKRINPLPPLKMPLFTIDTEDLVEVEAKCNKFLAKWRIFCIFAPDIKHYREL